MQLDMPICQYVIGIARIALPSDYSYGQQKTVLFELLAKPKQVKVLTADCNVPI